MSASHRLVPRPEATGHHSLLVTLARHGRLAAAATLFSTALRTTRALNSLLAALCSSSSSPAFLRVAPFVLLRAAPHASPDAATFRILTSALCRARRPSAAADVLSCMPALLLDPDEHHCRAVLASLCRCGPARDALAFLDDMRRWGVSPSRSDHRAVLDALLREGMAAEAYEAVVKQMDADGVAPGLPEFERILRAFSDGGAFDAVEEVFDEMLLRGLVPDVGVYNVYVGALCDKGDLAGARRMVECMERVGCPPDVRTFTVVVAGCVSAGDTDAAREAAREAIRRGLRWDAPALSELIGVLRAGGHVTQVRALLLEIMRDGCAAPLDASVFGQLIGVALCDNEEGLCAEAAGVMVAT
ncbi:pentatricopeptide repeat-containing protein At2g38420, mitochondrial-like [Phragmites australis]|uniref:pentatricopeptide repeat-containing protein At2g38420, mitochondrial-like n=1 Tax=Phragmites australis TaxID=29695 RepID=UPI002D766F47|nr:pentatricopeptide repeat-containing protein At2g38420, mitochondrial-like [Phragmites australis]